MSENKSKILVIDDEDKNLRLMEALLLPGGYEVITASNGELAIEKAVEKNPDVILLDVMMPGMDGFEICKRLKSGSMTAPIPVIMVTALKARDDRLKGMEAGANDFLLKPIDKEDLLLRVRNAAYAKNLFDQIQQNYENLKELEELRDGLTHMIIHDLRSPLSGLFGMLQLLDMKNENLSDKQKYWVESSMKSTTTLIEMTNSLLDIKRLEESKITLNSGSHDINILIKESIELLGTMKRDLSIGFTPQEQNLIITCDGDLIRRVIVNLLSNAVKFTPEGGSIGIVAKASADHVIVTVEDNGPGIPSEFHKKIFEKFGQVEIRKENKVHSTGLGLTFCKFAVEAHVGEIGLKSKPGRGSTFWFTLPYKLNED